MTARTAVAIASLAVGLGTVGCINFYDIGIETPINAKLDTSAFQRVLITGFVSGGSGDVDANSETVRLMRSQLRTKSDLKVIDADVVALADVVDRRRKDLGLPAAAPVAPPQAAPAATAATAATPGADKEPKIKNEKDLEAYDQIFADADYWKKIGEEFQGPLIVTGSILFNPIQKSGIVARPTEQYDATGQRRVVENRQWMDRKGYEIVPKFVFIDGRTGAVLYSQTFREETLYDVSQNTPPLSSYFELMDRVMPGFLNTLSNQKIRGTRTLIK